MSYFLFQKLLIQSTPIRFQNGAEPMALTLTYSVSKVVRATDSSEPTVRGLIDAGIVDAYKSETGHRMCPPHAIQQVREHLARVKKGAAA
jgi:hypothetical protein